MSAAVHSFETSWNADGADWWEPIYRAFFVDYKSHETVTDVSQQKAGIDHRVSLTGGGEVLVDVKTREKFRPDVLVEVWSSKQAGTPGWARKSLHCHYVAYAFLDLPGFAYVIPFSMLRAAYEANKHKWAADASCQTVTAANRRYDTVSVAVPYERFLRDVAGAMQVYVNKDERPFT